MRSADRDVGLIVSTPAIVSSRALSSGHELIRHVDPRVRETDEKPPIAQA